VSLPDICVVDTNVPKVANLAIAPDPDSDIGLDCIQACVDAIEHVIKHRLVIDEGGEIFMEYLREIPMKGQGGVGSRFMKWVNDHRWSAKAIEQVAIHREGNSYREFPKNSGLKKFDPSDRKFVAVANAHKDKPPILQATDSKWVGWEASLAEEKIGVCFVCVDYIQAKYKKKKKT
jgi:hypothetical protein